MHQLHRTAIASVLGFSSWFGLSSSVNSAPLPPLFAVLLGGNEVSSTGLANAGDQDGGGSATVKISVISNSRARLCFGITASRITTPILAHIHQGDAGTNGPVVVDLLPPVNGASSGCVTLPMANAMAIQNNPLNYYVNVHTADFPGGAIRGQLH